MEPADHHIFHIAAKTQCQLSILGIVPQPYIVNIDSQQNQLHSPSLRVVEPKHKVLYGVR